MFSSYSFVVCESLRVKRSQPATNGNGPASKKGRGGMQNQLVNRAFEGLSHGGRGSGRGRGRGGRGRGWGGYHWDQLESYSTWHRRMSFLLPLESKSRDRCSFVVCFTGVGSPVCNDLLGMQLQYTYRKCKRGCLRMWTKYVQRCCSFTIHWWPHRPFPLFFGCFKNWTVREDCC